MSISLLKEKKFYSNLNIDAYINNKVDNKILINVGNVWEKYKKSEQFKFFEKHGNFIKCFVEFLSYDEFYKNKFIPCNTEESKKEWEKFLDYVYNVYHIEKQEFQQVRVKVNRQGYKEARGLVSVSKIKITNKELIEAINKAREEFQKSTRNILGVQNTVLLLLEKSLKNISSIKDVSEKKYKIDTVVENKFIMISFPIKKKELYYKLDFLVKQKREKFNLNKKAFGISTLILLLITSQLIKLKYLKEEK